MTDTAQDNMREVVRAQRNKIDDLIEGNVRATMDRITKTEALELIADNKTRQEKWIERYFERKK